MQEIIVFSITAIALAYLVVRFLGKRKSSGCDKCGCNENNEYENH